MKAQINTLIIYSLTGKVYSECQAQKKKVSHRYQSCARIRITFSLLNNFQFTLKRRANEAYNAPVPKKKNLMKCREVLLLFAYLKTRAIQLTDSTPHPQLCALN